MQLARVGIRQAKANLSKLIKLVQSGKGIILTDRGKPVAEIVPISNQMSAQEKIKRLEEQGIIESYLTKKGTALPEPIKLPNSLAQKMLQEDRENGQ